MARIRATICLDAGLHMALRVKAAETDQSVSDLVNAAVRSALSEDVADLAAFRERSREPVVSFKELLCDLKKRKR